jgi:hypothetical protein
MLPWAPPAHPLKWWGLTAGLTGSRLSLPVTWLWKAAPVEPVLGAACQEPSPSSFLAFASSHFRGHEFISCLVGQFS